MRFIAQRAGGGEVMKLDVELKKLKADLNNLEGTHSEMRNPQNLFFYLFYTVFYKHPFFGFFS